VGSRACSTSTRWRRSHRYLESLGVDPKHIVFSDFTSMEMYRTGRRARDRSMLPSKVALAHVHNLLFVKHKRPARLHLLPDGRGRAFAHRGDAGEQCLPHGLADAADRPRRVHQGHNCCGGGCPVPRRLLDMEDEPLFRRQMFTSGRGARLVVEENERAIAAGRETLADYDRTVRAARVALDALERETGWHSAARTPLPPRPGTESRHPEELQKLGYPCSRRARSGRRRSARTPVRRRVRAGIIQHPSTSRRLEALDGGQQQPEDLGREVCGAPSESSGGRAVDFKCGHDAPIYATSRNHRHSGTPYFGFKDIDENKPVGAIKLRLETIDYSLKRARESLLNRGRQTERIEKWLAAYERGARQLGASLESDDDSREVIPLQPCRKQGFRLRARDSRSTGAAEPVPRTHTTGLRCDTDVRSLGHVAWSALARPFHRVPVLGVGVRQLKGHVAGVCTTAVALLSPSDLPDADRAGVGFHAPGAFYGLFPIGWIVISAVFLYRSRSRRTVRDRQELHRVDY